MDTTWLMQRHATHCGRGRLFCTRQCFHFVQELWVEKTSQSLLAIDLDKLFRTAFSAGLCSFCLNITLWIRDWFYILRTAFLSSMWGIHGDKVWVLLWGFLLKWRPLSCQGEQLVLVLGWGELPFFRVKGSWLWTRTEGFVQYTTLEGSVQRHNAVCVSPVSLWSVPTCRTSH